MSRINVLWVIDHVCYDGNLHGGGRLYWNVVPRFDPDRFKVVPCFLRSSDEVREVFEGSPAPVTIFDKGKYDLTTLFTFLRIIKRENIHLMHLHCYASSVFGRAAGMITGVPTIIHDYDTNIYFPYVWYLRITDRVFAGKTSGAVAASPKVRDFLINRRKIEANKIRMMFHAVPTEESVPISAERIAKTREKLGINNHAKIVGTFTKLGPERGNRYLIRTAAEVLKSALDTHFVIVHKPTYYHRVPDAYKGLTKIYDPAAMEEELLDLVSELGIEKRIHLIESLDDPDELMSICDVVVAPFLDDRFSSVYLLKAMTRGTPLIATDFGEQREIIKNGVNGYLVSPGDVKELAETILKVLADPEKLQQMSIQARTMSEQYSVDAYVETLQEWYTALANNRSNRYSS